MRLLRTLLFLILIVLLAACGGAAQPGTTEEVVTTATLAPSATSVPPSQAVLTLCTDEAVGSDVIAYAHFEPNVSATAVYDFGDSQTMFVDLKPGEILDVGLGLNQKASLDCDKSAEDLGKAMKVAHPSLGVWVNNSELTFQESMTPMMNGSNITYFLQMNAEVVIPEGSAGKLWFWQEVSQSFQTIAIADGKLQTDLNLIHDPAYPATDNHVVFVSKHDGTPYFYGYTIGGGIVIYHSEKVLLFEQ